MASLVHLGRYSTEQFLTCFGPANKSLLPIAFCIGSGGGFSIITVKLEVSALLTKGVQGSGLLSPPVGLSLDVMANGNVWCRYPCCLFWLDGH